jgi:GDP-4-dehydro-6-deoxy-D-mannose reductase
VRAFVTGGNGFVGTWLVAHLEEQDDDVVAVDHDVDVRDGAAVRTAVRDAAPDAIYHLAALTHVGKSWDGPEEVLQVNTMGTLHVLQAARACASPPRVLLVSSAEVYGVVEEGSLPAKEDMPLEPVTPYAASKVAAEYLGVQAHLAHGLHVVRVRPFNHVGPGQGPGFVVPSLAARIVEGLRRGGGTVPVGNLSARRDLTDVRDVVRAYRLLVERGIPGEVYNVCSGRAVAVTELADRMLRMAGVDLELVPDPELVRPVDVPVMFGDPSKLMAATGWAPRIDLDQTLADVLAEWEERIADAPRTR